MTRRHRTAVAAIFTAIVGFASLAQGQADEPPAQYQELIDRALHEMAAERWEEARSYFHRAHAAFPNARTRRGIGIVSFELRDYVDAVRHLQRSLTDPRRPLNDDQRAEVEGLLERALGLVGHFSLSELPPGSRVVVDGHPATPEQDGGLLLAIGEHEIRVTGALEGETRFTVRGGESGPIPIALEETRPPIDEPPPEEPRTPPPPPPSPGSPTARGR